MLTFEVFGVPAPKGSTKAFWRPGMRHAVVTHDNARTKPWQQLVLDAARTALGSAAPMDGYVGVAVTFFLPRPASAPKRITLPGKKPDVDKLLRALLDGLTTAGVYRDDGQVTDVQCLKRFAGGMDDPRGAAGVPRALVSVVPIMCEPKVFGAMSAGLASAQGSLL
jgi:Holliday junction resolvase RusA-like endonuclease